MEIWCKDGGACDGNCFKNTSIVMVYAYLRIILLVAFPVYFYLNEESIEDIAVVDVATGSGETINYPYKELLQATPFADLINLILFFSLACNCCKNRSCISCLWPITEFAVELCGLQVLILAYDVLSNEEIEDLDLKFVSVLAAYGWILCAPVILIAAACLLVFFYKTIRMVLFECCSWHVDRCMSDD